MAEDGTIYAWGSGYGKTPNTITISKDFENKIGEKVEQISVGTSYTMLLGESGKAYIYRESAVSIVQTDANTELTDIKEISAGNNYAVLVTKSGKVYTIRKQRLWKTRDIKRTRRRRSSRESICNIEGGSTRNRKSKCWI